MTYLAESKKRDQMSTKLYLRKSDKICKFSQKRRFYISDGLVSQLAQGRVFFTF